MNAKDQMRELNEQKYAAIISNSLILDKHQELLDYLKAITERLEVIEDRIFNIYRG